jgi:membrane protein YdbS with pleckstrin-like domain
MDEFVGVKGTDVLIGFVIATSLSLCIIGASQGAKRDGRSRFWTIMYWIVLAWSATLCVGAVVNLTMIALSSFWMALGAAGVIGVAVGLACGPKLWRARREAEERRMFVQDL